MEERVEKAVYLFCFAWSEPLSALQGTGIDEESPLFLKIERNVAAVLSEVALNEFAGPEAEARMNDIAWIAPKALRHENVVEEVMGLSPVFPARFGALFLSMDRIEHILREHYDTISTFLERMEDKEEWAVKAYLEREKAIDQLLSSLISKQDESSMKSPGMRYIQEKRLKLAVEKELTNWLHETCDGLLHDLKACTENFMERKTLAGGSDDVEGDMVLNWAFLVPRAGLKEFREIIQRANAELKASGLTFVFSGAWPPYSFTPVLTGEP